MSLVLNLDFQQSSDKTSLFIKDISAPTFNQEGWGEGSSPNYDEVTVNKFVITTPDDKEIDLTTEWAAIMSTVSGYDELIIEVKETSFGLEAGVAIPDGIYEIEYEIIDDTSGVKPVHAVRIQFFIKGQIENTVYSLYSDIIDYYGNTDIESKTYIEDCILMKFLFDSIDYSIASGNIDEAEDTFEKLQQLIAKYE